MATIEQTGGDEGQPEQGGRGAKGGTVRVELSRREQALARRVAESKATVPHFYLTRGLALATPPSGIVEKVLSACAVALREQPRLNSSYRDGAIEQHARVNVGFVVDAEVGALVPIVADADEKDVAEIASELSRLSERARSEALTSPELAGGTFTITVLDAGADSLLPTVLPGQSAHLAVGRTRESAIVRDGAVRPGHTLELVLACDHRAVRAADAAAFLERLASQLEGPPPAGL